MAAVALPALVSCVGYQIAGGGPPEHANLVRLGYKLVVQHSCVFYF